MIQMVVMNKMANQSISMVALGINNNLRYVILGATIN